MSVDVTDKDTGGSPKVPKVRESRRHSPWPLVIVVALPIISALIRLPLLVTVVLLVLGTVLLMLSPHLGEKRARDPKKAWFQLMATFARLQSAHAALEQSPADAAARQRFAKLEAECRSLLNSRPDSAWGTDSDYAATIRKQIAEMSAPVPDKVEGPAPAPVSQTGRLEELRQAGVMSDSEFQSLSERFKALAAEKACAMLETIAGLQLQCRQATMTEEDFHVALRGLLERLDHGDGEAAPRPVAPAEPGQGARRLTTHGS
jgi:hypothetical protein